MPCYTVRTTQVDLSAMGKIDLQLLADALTALGLEGITVYADRKQLVGEYVSYQNGKLELQGALSKRITMDKVRYQYGVAVVKATAKRFGWQMQEITQDQKGTVRR